MVVSSILCDSEANGAAQSFLQSTRPQVTLPNPYFEVGDKCCYVNNQPSVFCCQAVIFPSPKSGFPNPDSSAMHETLRT